MAVESDHRQARVRLAVIAAFVCAGVLVAAAAVAGLGSTGPRVAGTELPVVVSTLTTRTPSATGTSTASTPANASALATAATPAGTTTPPARRTKPRTGASSQRTRPSTTSNGNTEETGESSSRQIVEPTVRDTHEEGGSE